VIGEGAGGTGESSERVDTISRGWELLLLRKFIILTMALKSLCWAAMGDTC